MATDETPIETFTVEAVDPSSENPFTASEDQAPISSGELACIVCGSPLTYGGRGPKPKYCAEHKTNKSKSASASSGGSQARIERLMAQRYLELSTLVMVIDPTAAMIIADRADSLAHQWAALAESNPKVKRALLRTNDGMGWAGVILGHTMLAIAIMNAHEYEPPFITTAKERVFGKLPSE